MDEVPILKKLWPYSKDDKSTWPWLTCMIGGRKTADGKQELYVTKWVKNPDFKYGHLIKGYNDDDKPGRRKV